MGVGAEQVELDPLLELLVEQGVITMEQALAVQAEYDRRRAAEQAPAHRRTAQTVAVEGAGGAGRKKKAAEETKDEKWYDRIDFKGDLRLRGEFFWVDGISSNDRRERFRARIRPGIYTDITDWMEVGLQLRSGDPMDPVSDNSSFDGGFSLIPISISEGYAGFHLGESLDLTIGKFDPKKKWVVTDMQWDDDVTVEGAMQELSFGPLKVDFYQYILEEDKRTRDSYLLGGQLYGKFGSDSVGSFTVGAGYRPMGPAADGGRSDLEWKAQRQPRHQSCSTTSDQLDQRFRDCQRIRHLELEEERTLAGEVLGLRLPQHRRRRASARSTTPATSCASRSVTTRRRAR